MTVHDRLFAAPTIWTILFCTMNPIVVAQWTQSTQTEGRFVTSMTMHGDTVFAATSDSGVYRSADNGSTWSAAKTGLAKDILAITSTGTTLFAGRDGGMYRSTNNGVSWTTANSGLTNPAVYALFISGTTIFAGTAGNGAFRSTDNGGSWSAANTGMPTAFIQAFTGAGSNIFAGTRTGGVYRSTDNGNTWTQVNTGLTNLTVLALCSVGTDIYMGSAGGGVYYSTNNGASWIPLTAGLTTTMIYALCTRSGSIFAGGLPGGFANLFFSATSGANWSSVSGDLPLVTINSLTTTGTYVLVGTAARGIWRRPLSGLTAVAGRAFEAIPIAPSLAQNYPNPFNPSTRIQYALPYAANVSLRIFNTLGQVVAILVDEKKEPGTYDIAWTGSNMPGGVYYYRLQSRHSDDGSHGEFTSIKKMILLK